jgi:hypothetical protein
VTKHRTHRTHRKTREPDNSLIYVFLILAIIFVGPSILTDLTQLVIPQLPFTQQSSLIQTGSTVSIPVNWDIKRGSSNVKTSMSPLSVITGGETITSITATATLNYQVQGTVTDSTISDQMQVLFDGALKKSTTFSLPSSYSPPVTIGTITVSASEIEAWAGSAYGDHTITLNIPSGGTFTVGFSSGGHVTVDVQGSSKSVTVTIANPHTILHFAAPMGDNSWADKTTGNVRSHINEFMALTGKPIYGYVNWIAEWPGDFNWMLGSSDHGLKSLFIDGTLKALGVNWAPRLNGNDYDQQTVRDIAADGYDSYIRTVADECRAFGYPIYLRFGPEMNINQGGSGDIGTWAANPTDFIQAWRRIYDLFHMEGASNVLFVWCPNYSESGQHHYTEYYPGDEYVDWVGIDMYQFSDSIDPASEMGIYDDYGSRKPVGIFEWGTNAQDWRGTPTPDAARASYMTKFFNAIEARPNLKLISYFYYGNFKFDSSTPLTLAVYKNRVASTTYIGK